MCAVARLPIDGPCEIRNTEYLFTDTAQCMATAEEAAAHVVSVRQQQGVRAPVGWVVFGQVRGLV